MYYPVLIKPNIGGSGAGIVSFAEEAELRVAAARDELDFGPDGTALVQEHLPAAGDAVYRLEFLNGELLYGIRLLLAPSLKFSSPLREIETLVSQGLLRIRESCRSPAKTN